VADLSYWHGLNFAAFVQLLCSSKPTFKLREYGEPFQQQPARSSPLLAANQLFSTYT
jgi:hypothetical protein